MSIVTTGNIKSLLERGLYVPKKKVVKPKQIKKTKNKGN
jgi:hypothetical protein